MRVTISPNKHAYFAGETLHVRIEFDSQDRQPRIQSVVHEDGKADGNGKVARHRLGIVGVRSTGAETEHGSALPGPSSSTNPEDGKGTPEGKTLSTPGTGQSTPQPVAPVPVPVVVIPQHHPHARKISIAQVPTPPSLLGTPPLEEGKGDDAVVEGQGAVTPAPRFRSPLATISESHPSSTGPPPRISTATTTQPLTHPIITFATIQMTGQMTPSTAYIPPEPLIPLRNLLLLQPIGSNSSSLAPPPTPTSSSTDTTSHFAPLHFSPTSAIDNAAADGTLTSSLTSLARGLFSPVTAGGAAEGEGTWEDHRKQVWLSRELPVWISPKDVVCVDTHVDSNGKISSTNIATPPKTGSGAKTPDEGKLSSSSSIMSSPLSALSSSSTAAWKLFSPVRAFKGAQMSNLDQQTLPPRVVQKELVVPVRVLPRITVPPTGESYDILLPVIPRTSSGSVQQVPDEARKGTPSADTADKKNLRTAAPRESGKEDDVEGFMRLVKETLRDLHGGETRSQTAAPVGEDQKKTLRIPSAMTGSTVEDQILPHTPSAAENDHDAARKQEEEADSGQMSSRFDNLDHVRKEEDGQSGALLHGNDKDHEDDELAEESGRCRLDDASSTTPPPPIPPPAPPPLSTGRLHTIMSERLSGTEAIQALIRSSRPANHSAPTQPLLKRTVAQYGNAYTLDLARTGFALGIPADATPAFQICAGNAAEETGGLSWGLHLRFLVRERASGRRKQGHAVKRADDQVDEHGYQRSGMTGELIQQDKAPDLELDVDIVECTIPLSVYPNDRGKPHVREFHL
ncbi:hypothetical protein QFC22_004196 [Naganishia vaughanmartiniae]|uniref:Uncharacterized protein n=1 Tax=Naganishia vaughanmartiniae TaxID=1424756 RepID=A0ACC2X2L7_9TREE|nr:hypothetical protein QFC22_004196 [Naganishia vaughanmartiniae]